MPKSGPIWRMSAEEATLAGKPRYNGFACGSGAHGDRKYNRTRATRAWQKEIRNEGTSRRGPFPFARWLSTLTLRQFDPFYLSDGRNKGTGRCHWEAFHLWYPMTNCSRSPLSTASTLPVSTLLRKSFTSWYGYRT